MCASSVLISFNVCYTGRRLEGKTDGVDLAHDDEEEGRALAGEEVWENMSPSYCVFSSAMMLGTYKPTYQPT